MSETTYELRTSLEGVLGFVEEILSDEDNRPDEDMEQLQKVTMEALYWVNQYLDGEAGDCVVLNEAGLLSVINWLSIVDACSPENHLYPYYMRLKCSIAAFILAC